MALRVVSALLLAALVASECPTSTWLQTGDNNCYLPLLSPPFGMPTPGNATDMCKIVEENAHLVEIYNEHDQVVVS